MTEQDEGIHIAKQEIVDFLTEFMGHKPTEQDVSEFTKFASRDTHEWLKDNFKSWSRNRHE